MKLRVKIVVTVMVILLIILSAWIYSGEIIFPASVITGITIPIMINWLTFLLSQKISMNRGDRIMRGNVVGFFSRLILYAVVIAIVVKITELHMVSFIISFTVTFVFLTIIEALYFSRVLSRQNERK